MGTHSIFIHPKLQYLQHNGTIQTFTACMLQELHHLSNPSVMTIFPFPFLPTIKHGTKYCIRFPFFNVKVETVVTQKVIQMPAMIIRQKSNTGL